MDSEIKVLCDNHKVCDDVMRTLGDMGFTRIKDVSSSSVSFDITAKRKFRDEKDEENTINKVFDRCGGKIHEIQVSRKRSGFF